MVSLSQIELLERLIAFESVSRTSNLALINFVRNYLQDFVVESFLVYNDSQTQANLYATIGPHDQGGVMLSGHTDVVPVTNQAWTQNPFELNRRDDRLVGRGSCDMKGYIASVLSNVPNMVEKKLTTPIHLAFSYDEEIGCVGVQDLVEKLRGFDVQPKMGVIGEPTNMRTILGHKGKRSYRVKFSGFSCHSAFINDGVNAIEYAAELIVFIQRMNRKLAQQGRTDSGYEVEHTTFHTGTISGGTALNIVPSDCQFDFEIRNLPQDNVDTLVEEIQSYAKAVLLSRMRKNNELANIEFDMLSAYPGLHHANHSHCAQMMQDVNAGCESHEKLSFGTEAGTFQKQLEIDCVVCGPGSIMQAHKADEYVTLEQLQKCAVLLDNIVYRCRTGL